MRSAKQRRNDKRLGMMAKRRGSRRVNKRVRRRTTMARRRGSRRRRAGGFIRRVGRRAGGVKGIIATARPMAAGIGGGLIGEAIANRVYPSAAPMAGFGGAYFFGGLKGVGGKILFDVISGRGFSLGGLGGNTGVSSGV